MQRQQSKHGQRREQRQQRPPRTQRQCPFRMEHGGSQAEQVGGIEQRLLQSVEHTLDGLTKRYGSLTVVDVVSFSIEGGRFLTLLGPSGSGKTTLLMMIAGFVAPSSGTIRLDGRAITKLLAWAGIGFIVLVVVASITIAEPVNSTFRRLPEGQMPEQAEHYRTLWRRFHAARNLAALAALACLAAAAVA